MRKAVPSSRPIIRDREHPSVTSVDMRESNIEKHLLDSCRKHGLLCLKFVSPQRSGVPDRVVIASSGTVFVEVKRPGRSMRRKQRAMANKMRRYGARVFSVNTIEQVDDLITDLLEGQVVDDEVA